MPTTRSPATSQTATASAVVLLCTKPSWLASPLRGGGGRSGGADAGKEGRHLGFQIVGARRQPGGPGGDFADGTGAAGHRLFGGADFARSLRGVASGGRGGFG